MIPLISLESTTFGYSRDIVLNDVSFVVSEGDFIGIVGPNGAGKSTLLKGCIGLLLPQSGTVVRHGAASRLGYVPQRDRLDSIYPLTAIDVVALGLVADRPWWATRQRGDRARVLEALNDVGMGDLASASFGSLSGGQRQRVLIARALVTNPTLLVLDEPMSGVDRSAEEAILKLLSLLHTQKQKTIVMVSHHLDKIKPHVSRLVSVQDGTIHE